MSPDCEISECPEFEVKSKLFMNEKILEEYSLRVYEIGPFFLGITKPILLSSFQLQKLMNKAMRAENLFVRRKDNRHQKKNLLASLLELIQVMQEVIMIQTMKLVKYKYLSVNLRTKN